MGELNHNEEELITRIIDDLEGNLSPDEKLELKHWRDASPRNEETWQEYDRIYKEMDILAIRQKANADTAWASFEKRLLLVHESKVTKLAGTTKWWVGIAASLLLVLGYYFYNQGNGNITISTASNEHKEIVLPDGSVAALNQNTSIQYNGTSYKRARDLNLMYGEAFFNVRHDPDRPFTINLGKVTAIDLGTSFNVSRNSNDVNLIVQTGKVALKHALDKRQLILEPGMQGTFIAAENKLSDTPNVNINYKSWLDKKLVFVNSPLPYVVKQLENTYHAKLTLKGDALKNRRLTAHLHYQTIDSALVIVSASLGCNFKKVSGRYILME
ncbi:DUF4974 domain-containing protein (plasmid) [Pedobacter sp. BS3]|uniref:FecR family protein n=1 Tax=Pedobacter sp. BS3 TaxID=2567937 RepID=UPI0011EF7469|nr:FecR domain-containing protein [Pedobacter sp. BS3]TZF85919.1 DUF4974 domain-containing protein [Pedobacter sp. BS3]